KCYPYGALCDTHDITAVGSPQQRCLPISGCRSRQAHQRLSDTDGHAFANTVTDTEPVRRKQNDGRTVLEPAELVAFAIATVTIKDMLSLAEMVQQSVQAVQPDAGDQDGGDRDQRRPHRRIRRSHRKG